MLWREVQDYAHSTGLVIKKLPISVLKANRTNFEREQRGEGPDTGKRMYPATAAFKQVDCNEGVRTKLMSYANDPALKSWIDETIDGQPYRMPMCICSSQPNQQIVR